MAEKKKRLPDYYAALELKPGASQEEIGKQYKKMAMLYHPDRNPGQEDIFKSKFQAIQAAHEVLADPTQRRTYDSKRRQDYNETPPRPDNPVRNQFAGAYASQRASNQRFNDRQYRRNQGYNAGPTYTGWSYNAPRPTSGPQPSTGGPPPPSAGAARFHHDFNRGPPPPPPGASAAQARNRNNAAQDDAESHAEAWRNFYKKQQSDRGKASGFKSAGEGMRSDEGPSTKPGFARTNTSSSGSARFNPNLRGDQWEPQAQSTSSYNTYTRPAPQPPHINVDGVPPPHPSENYSPRDPRNPDRRAEDVPYAEGNPRISTPYSTRGGETTYFSSDFLKRSNSTRDAPGLARESNHRKRDTGPFGKAPPRARSASPSSRLKPDQPRPANTWSTAADNGREESPEPRSDPFRANWSSQRPHDHRRPRNFSPSSTAANAGSSRGTPPRTRAKKDDNSSRNDGASLRMDNANSKQDGANVRNGGGTGNKSFDLGSPPSSDADSSSEAESDPSQRDAPAEVYQRTKAEPSSFWQERKPQTSAKQASEDVPGERSDTFRTGKESEHNRRSTGSEVPNNKSNFGTGSNQPVQTQFLSSEWKGQFHGSPRPHSQGRNQASTRTEQSPAPSSSHWSPRPSSSGVERNPFDPNDIKFDSRSKNGTPGPKTHGAAANSFKTPTMNSKASTTNASKAPLPKTNGATTTPFDFPPPPPGSPPKNDAVPQPNQERRGSVKFSSEEWQKLFTEPKWAFPQSSDGRTSPSKGTVPSRRTSIVEMERKKGKKSAATAAVAEETDESEVPKERMPAPAGATPTPRATQPKMNSPDAMDIDTEPRPSPATPRGPRLVPAEATRPEWRDPFSPTSTLGAVPSAVPNAVPPPTTLPGPPPGPPPQTTSRPVSSGNDKLNLSGLANAAPFSGTTGASLNNLSDLTTGLPFQSAPSSKPPQNSAAPQRPRFYPKLSHEPRAPTVPQGALTQSKLKAYFKSMASYMEQHHRFEGEMLSHLSKRYEYDARFGTALKARTLIDTVGDSSKGTGVEALAEDLEYESKLLDAYAKAKAKFKSAMDELVKVKQRVAATGVAAG